MPLRTLTELRRTGGVQATNTVNIGLNDNVILNIRGFSKIRATTVVAAFGTGAITLTVTASIDGINYEPLTFVGAATVTANGAYPLVAIGTAVVGASVQTPASTLVDITGYNFIQITRGNDTNVATVFTTIEARR
jgi:hypothetical protein